MSEISEKVLTEYKLEVERLKEEIYDLRNKMNPYSKEQSQLLFKIQAVKSEVIEANPKMSGHNSYKNYDYFELKDLMPVITPLLLKYKLSSTFIPMPDKIALQIVDTETGAWFQWQTPIKRVPNPENKYPKGDLGARMKEEQALYTYARRGLWIQVLDIVEAVTVEQDGNGEKTEQKPRTNEIITEIKDKLESSNMPVKSEYIQKRAIILHKKGKITDKELEEIKKQTGEA